MSTPSLAERLIWTGRMVSVAARQPRFPFAPAATIAAAQERRVRATVAYARAYVPYYRETMRRLLLGPEDLATASALARLPLLEREQIQRDPEYFLSSRWPAEAAVVLNSGGTTGTSIPIFRDPPSLLAETAYGERLRSLVVRLAGRRVRYREAFIAPSEGSVETAMSGLRRHSLLPIGLRVQRRRFSMFSSPAEVVPALHEYRPDVIRSYGSYLEALFVHIREQSPVIALPRVVTYGADSMSTEARDWVQGKLGIDVLSAYNAVETSQIGFECDHHRGHHLNVDLCPVRLIDSDGGEAAEDAAGEVVVSNLINRGTVLLNYRLGDVVTRVTGPCPCGRTLPLGSYVERRGTRWLELGGRRLQSQSLQLILRTEPDIWRYQIVQTESRVLLLRLVAGPACDRATTASRIGRRFREAVGDGIAVRLEFVADLDRASSGKVAPVVTLSGAGGRSRQGGTVDEVAKPELHGDPSPEAHGALGGV